MFIKKKLTFVIFIITLSLILVSCSKPPENEEVGINTEAPSTSNISEEPDSPKLEDISTKTNNSNNDEISVEKDEPKSKPKAPRYSGEWNRTNVIKAAGSSLTITNEESESFDFNLTAFWGDHFGDISGKATKKIGGEYIYKIEPEEYHNGGAIRFLLNDKNILTVAFEGDPISLDFGSNVIPDGEYVLENPVYVSEEYPVLVFGNQNTSKMVKALMVETNPIADERFFNTLLEIMIGGIPEIVESRHYKGYLPGTNMSVELHITDDENIYILTNNFGDDDFLPYVFYSTNIDHAYGIRPDEIEFPEGEEVSLRYHPAVGLSD